ncbi:TPR-like protein [Viridothelium virens]|uniref:ER membrane protein complex subunit 2 n=1 Tax=Viridothelium virens TaxID=1048519 RepID=A0A6A6HIJ0_VIRVR|nr:TPR-like protein [Viridothelium virens]
MSIDLLQPPTHVPPSTALRISQQAPTILRNTSGFRLPYPLSLFVSTESQELWTTQENLFLACLRTGDDKSALHCLEKLTERFGGQNERIMALRGLYHEATAENSKALEEVLEGYVETLEENPTNMPIRKRTAALLKSLGRPAEAIQTLVALLDSSPTDAEAWSEMAELYTSQGQYYQAIYCLEEVLLIMPNAWSVHARLGEILFRSCSNLAGGNGDLLKTLSESMRRFCRSIELCENYLRGYYGLKLSTKKLLDVYPKSSKQSQAVSDPATGDLAPPTLRSIQRLHELATGKLGEMVRRGSVGERGWNDYDEAELIAARELLDRDTQPIER